MPNVKRKQPKTWDDYKDRYERPTGVRLPAELKRDLARAAAEQETTTSQVLATLAAAWVRRYNKRKRAGTLRASRSAARRVIYTNAKSSPARATGRRAGGKSPPCEERTPVM